MLGFPAPKMQGRPGCQSLAAWLPDSLFIMSASLPELIRLLVEVSAKVWPKIEAETHQSIGR